MGMYPRETMLILSLWTALVRDGMAGIVPCIPTRVYPVNQITLPGGVEGTQPS